MINKRIFVYFGAIVFYTSFSFAYPNHYDNRGHDKQSKQQLSSIPISLSNNLSDLGSDLILSGVYGISYLNQEYQLNQSVLGRLGVLYSGFMLALLNHEINGHAVRIKEFGYKVQKIEIGIFGGFVGYDAKIDRDFFQKQSIFSIGGNQINHLLSEKIAWNLLSSKNDLDNAVASAYIFSSQNQVFYSYIKESGPGHDLDSHSENMQALYGKGSITMKKIKSAAFLDLLDPILLASLHSSFTGDTTKIPMLKVGDIGLTAGMKAVLTPYAVIEKRINLYIDTEYTPIMISFGFGKEQKTNTPYIEDLSSYVKKHTNNINILDKERDKKINELEGSLYAKNYEDEYLNKKAENHNTYYFELKFGKILKIDSLGIGASFATWSQPELFTAKPREAKMKKGFFGSIDFNHETNDTINLFGSVGYKTKGFMIGKPVKSTPIVTVGLKLMI
jgi:hypothetical protein